MYKQHTSTNKYIQTETYVQQVQIEGKQLEQQSLNYKITKGSSTMISLGQVSIYTQIYLQYRLVYNLGTHYARMLTFRKDSLMILYCVARTI